MGQLKRKLNFADKTIEELVQMARLDDADAIGELYERTIHSVFFVAKKYIREEQDAKDVLQEAYVSAFGKLEQLKDDDKFIPWLNRIVANKAKDYLKKKKPLLFSDTASEDQNVEEFIEDESLEFNPSEVYNYQELKIEMEKIIDNLSDENRMSILMFYFQQLSIAEIANVFQVSQNTIKSRLNYGKKQIKKSVEALEAKGMKLRGVMPMSTMLWFMKELAIDTQIPKDVVASILPAIGGATATAFKLGGFAISSATLTKLVAGITASAVLLTGGAVYLNNSNSGVSKEVPIRSAKPIGQKPEPKIKKELISTWEVKPQYALDERPIALYDKGFLLTENEKSRFIDSQGIVVFEKEEKYLQCLKEDTYAFYIISPANSGIVSYEYVSNLLGMNGNDSEYCGITGIVGPQPFYDSKSNKLMISTELETGIPGLREVIVDEGYSNETIVYTVDDYIREGDKIIVNPEEKQGYILYKGGSPISQNIYTSVNSVLYNTVRRYIIIKLGALEKKGKWKLIDEEGVNLTKLEYDDMKILNGEYAKFSKGNLVGLLDNKGNVVFEGEYEDVSAPSGNTIMVKAGGLWGIMKYK